MEEGATEAETEEKVAKVPCPRKREALTTSHLHRRPLMIVVPRTRKRKKRMTKKVLIISTAAVMATTEPGKLTRFRSLPFLKALNGGPGALP